MARLCLLGIRTTLFGHGGLCQDNRLKNQRNTDVQNEYVVGR